MFIRCEVLMVIMFLLGASLFKGLACFVEEIRKTMMYLNQRKSVKPKKKKEVETVVQGFSEDAVRSKMKGV